MYKGDFGRTIPVSGHFSHDQRETMELLNGAFLLVGTVRPGSNGYHKSNRATLNRPAAR